MHYFELTEWRRGLGLGLIGLLAVAALPSAAIAAAPTPRAKEAAIGRDVRRVMARYDVPGAAVMVLRDGRVTYVGTFGWRDAARRLPVRRDTLFEIGSITKQFTAACILQLQAAGKLQIDRPLSDYLPEAPHASEVTLRQLLTHTSGLHDYITDAQGEIDAKASQPSSYPDLIARIASLPLDFPPGSRWAYSNTGYLLLGRVIETVSGETYWDYLRGHILQPLRMTRTRTVADEGRLAAMAKGYRHRNGVLETAPVLDASWAAAAGLLVAPLDDLAKWDTALLAGKVVPASDYRLMTLPASTRDGASTGYGFGFFLAPKDDQPRIGHTGGSNGFTSADEYFPRQGVRIIAFTNLGDDKPEAGEALTNAVFADLYPEIAAKAWTSARGEAPEITVAVSEAFGELQSGRGYARFAKGLHDKLAGGVGERFVRSLGPYGPPSAAVFRGLRQDGAGIWYDYVMQFGPGVSMPFSARIGPDRLITSVSVG
jgi:CubicO group peptidase (beta-lactamase class C family)